MWKRLTAFLLVCSLKIIQIQCEYKRVCYWASWAVYRHGAGQHLVQDIDPFLCTHLIYSFAKLSPDYLLTSYDPWCDYDDGLGNFRKFNDLKLQNPKLKTLLAVGGWNLGSTIFSNMAMSHTTRSNFIISAISFLRKYGFDGLDIDWEYPTQRGGRREDQPNLTLLCKEFKLAAADESQISRKETLLLTLAISPNYRTLLQGYELETTSQYIDFINVMTYDFHGNWERIADHNSPLFPRVDQSEEHKKFTASYAIEFCLHQNVPSYKLIMGIPLYGRTFTLASSKDNQPGANAVSGGPAGPITQTSGVLAYNEICQELKDESWTIVWQNEYQAPYAVRQRLWIGYDDVQSITAKINFIKSKKLGGAMVWSLEQDDFRNICGAGNYVLTNTIKNALTGISNNENGVLHTSSPQVPTTNPLLSSPQPTLALLSTEVLPPRNVPTPTTIEYEFPTLGKPHTNECEKEGIFRNVQECGNFFHCIYNGHCGGGNCFDRIEMSCPEGLVFDETISVCNWPGMSPACEDTPENKRFTVTTGSPLNPGNECVTPGMFRNKKDCRKFYECVDKGDCNMGSCYIRWDKECPAPLVFDEGHSVCNWAHDAPPC